MPILMQTLLVRFVVTSFDSAANAGSIALRADGGDSTQTCYRVKGKVFPYSLPSFGPGADPGVQAVSPQMT